MSEFTLYPAIDLRGGRVVRLAQGDPERETEYSTDPGRVAARWVSAGADWLHVVNLNGALGQGKRENLQSLQEILLAGAKVQFGGGLREIARVREVFNLGVGRVVFGTAAVEDPELVELAMGEFGADRIALGLDAREGLLRVHGWQQAGGMGALELARQYAGTGVRYAVVTDISRDGMGLGLNLKLAREIQQRAGLKVIASGGVTSLGDVRAAQALGMAGVIIGRALYDGRIRLEEALGC
jgi:phosphoribosylformimino-5-aminoimidazole carboxamide ribotide isomerase